MRFCGLHLLQTLQSPNMPPRCVLCNLLDAVSLSAACNDLHYLLVDK